jgi:hypothetical protein
MGNRNDTEVLSIFTGQPVKVAIYNNLWIDSRQYLYISAVFISRFNLDMKGRSIMPKHG